ncbi:MAG TPA: hypothetical protein VFS96_00295 [Nitrolancea sp.]|nr:hypothetical protein [Nitrolancea sp.]
MADEESTVNGKADEADSDEPRVVRATELSGEEADRVEGELVVLQRSGAEKINAERVKLEQSGARTIDARSIRMDQSGTLTMKGERVVLENGTAGLISAGSVRMVRSQTILITAQKAQMEDSRALILIGKAEGNVQATFTLPTAAAFGAALGVAFAIIGVILRYVLSRR